MTIVLSSLRARQEAYERELAIEALKVSDGYIRRAAKICGLYPSDFQRLIAKHHLESMLNPKRGRPIGGNSAWRALENA